MTAKLIKLFSFELKRKLLNKTNWVSNCLFLLINVAIFPFTINPTKEILHQLFLSVIMTSIILVTVLINNNSFDEDAQDGSFDQYRIFGVSESTIYLSKVIVASIEFALIISITLPFFSIFYQIEPKVIFKIWASILLSAPLILSISIFGSFLTKNLSKNTSISILLSFPLLISSLINLSLSSEKIFNGYDNHFTYTGINLGLSLVIMPMLYWLSKFLK